MLLCRWLVDCLSGCVTVNKLLSNHFSCYSFSLILTKPLTHDLRASMLKTVELVVKILMLKCLANFVCLSNTSWHMMMMMMWCDVRECSSFSCHCYCTPVSHVVDWQKSGLRPNSCVSVALLDNSLLIYHRRHSCENAFSPSVYCLCMLLCIRNVPVATCRHCDEIRCRVFNAWFILLHMLTVVKNYLFISKPVSSHSQ